jgi:hypothetical protein
MGKNKKKTGFIFTGLVALLFQNYDIESIKKKILRSIQQMGGGEGFLAPI